MDKAFYIGLGVAIVFGLLPFAVKEIPHWLTWLGIAIGVIIVIWALIKPIPSIINGPFALFMIGCACIAASAVWYYARSRAVGPELKAPHQLEAVPPNAERPPKDQPITSSRSTDAIQWYFQGNNLIFGWNKASDGTLLVGTFNIRGKNLSGEPLTKIDAYLIPQISTTPLYLKFYDPRQADLIDTKDYFIEPDADFQLSYKLPSYDKEKSLQGTPVDVFLSRYGGIKFVFNHDDKTITHDFSYSEIKDVLLRKQEQHDQSKKTIPGLKKIPR